MTGGRARTDGEAARSRGGSGATWRLIDDGAHSASWNMAVDEAILDAVGMGLAPPTLRFYEWQTASVSIGRHQNAERDVRLEACEQLGIPVVRRPTGGRAILHGGDQTLSVVMWVRALGPRSESVIGSYRLLAAPLVGALSRLGIMLEAGPASARQGRGGDCFAVRTAADLVGPGGEKLVGSAQRRRGPVLLQQTSIRCAPPSVGPERVFRGPIAAAWYPLSEVRPSLLRAEVASAFAQELGLRLEAAPLSSWEEERACVLQAAARLPAEHG